MTPTNHFNPPQIKLAKLIRQFKSLFDYIPYTEKQSIKSRGDAYREYQERVSAFFPWPPKSSDTTSSS